MSTTINGISCYATETRGTAQSFVRVSVVGTNDVSDFDTAETAGGTAAGVQTVDFDGTVVGGNDAGLVTGTYTASINLDGVDYPISVPVTTADTFTTVVAAINADLPGTELAITGGNLVVTSPTTGLASYVVVTDADLFVGMSGYAGLLDSVNGGLWGQLSVVTLTNGANGEAAYSPAEETYDPSNPATAILTDYVRGDLNAVFADTEVEAELDLVKAKLDALQSIAK